MLTETATLWTFAEDGTVRRKVMAFPDLTAVLLEEDVDLAPVMRAQVRKWRAQAVTDRAKEVTRAYFRRLTREGVALEPPLRIDYANGRKWMFPRIHRIKVFLFGGNSYSAEWARNSLYGIVDDA